MLANYLKAYLRNLWKNKTYSFLNIIGLAVGISCSTLILLWVADEFNWDHQFSKMKWLYEVEDNQTYSGTTYTFAATPGPLAPALKTDIPGIANATRLTWDQRTLFSLDNKPIYERGNYCDPSFLSMFNLDFLKGNPATALNDLHSLVISQEMARAFFGDTDPMGHSLTVDNGDPYTITGVFRDLPENTSFRFRWLANYQVFYQRNQWLLNWGSNGIMTFVELKPTADLAAINKVMGHYVQDKSPGAAMRGFLYPMNDLRLYGSFANGKPDPSNGRIQYVRMFTLIAWIIRLST